MTLATLLIPAYSMSATMIALALTLASILAHGKYVYCKAQRVVFDTKPEKVITGAAALKNVVINLWHIHKTHTLFRNVKTTLILFSKELYF